MNTHSFIGVADESERFPLGAPVVRGPAAGKPAPAPIPIRGRPNWVRDEKGVEHYVEPIRPPVWNL